MQLILLAAWSCVLSFACGALVKGALAGRAATRNGAVSSHRHSRYGEAHEVRQQQVFTIINGTRDLAVHTCISLPEHPQGQCPESCYDAILGNVWALARLAAVR